VIRDDRHASRSARALGIGIRGTLGLVILAKQIASIPVARPVVEHLRRVGLFLTDDVANQALALVGEYQRTTDHWNAFRRQLDQFIAHAYPLRFGVILHTMPTVPRLEGNRGDFPLGILNRLCNHPLVDKSRMEKNRPDLLILAFACVAGFLNYDHPRQSGEQPKNAIYG
jgi:hypothetical protein